MKTKFNFKTVLVNSLAAVLALTISTKLIAQEKEVKDLENFKIVVEKTDDGIKMKSITGSAWIDLSFETNKNKPQAIDEYGMVESNKISSKKDANLADFLFTITKTEDGIVLQGIEGTAWNTLSFSLLENGKQAIDQFGMTKLN